MDFKQLAKEAAGAVNSALGATSYYTTESGEVIETDIVVRSDVPVKDDHGFIAGYAEEASILREDVCEIKNDETFYHTGREAHFKVIMVTKKTSAKWYVDIIEIPDGHL